MGFSHKTLSVYGLKQKRAVPGQSLEGKALLITSFLHWRLLLSYHSPIWKHQLLPGLDASASSFSTLTGFCLHWNLQLGGLDRELSPYDKLWNKAKAETSAAIMNSLLAVLSYRGVPSSWSAFPSLCFGCGHGDSMSINLNHPIHWALSICSRKDWSQKHYLDWFLQKVMI